MLNTARNFASDLFQLVRSFWRDEPHIAYQELRRRESLYRLLEDHASDIIWCAEPLDVVSYINPACKRLLGWAPESDNISGGVERWTTPESADRAARKIRTAIAEGRSKVSYDAEYYCADGGTVWCEVNVTIVYDQDGNATGSVGFARDISERRELTHQLAQVQKREALGAVAGRVAHDFNNYLTVVIGSLDIAISKGSDDPMLAGALSAAEKSACLARQLLTLSRKQPIQSRRFEINQFIQETESMLALAVAEDVSIVYQLNAASGLIMADPRGLEQILLNLVINASDAITQSGTITISTRDIKAGTPPAELVGGAGVQIVVADNGAGIPKNMLGHIFEPFFTTKPDGHGSGLGLAMVESVVKQSGGHISVSSKLSEGSEFVIALPAAPGMLASLHNVASEQPLNRGIGRKRKIMVVDDNDQVRASTRLVLEHSGFCVVAAHSGEAALKEVAADTTPDLLVTDIVMPGMNGIELASRLRSTFPTIPVILMSGFADVEGRELSAETLPGPLINKPFRATELIEAVCMQLGDSSLERSANA